MTEHKLILLKLAEEFGKDKKFVFKFLGKDLDDKLIALATGELDTLEGIERYSTEHCGRLILMDTSEYLQKLISEGTTEEEKSEFARFNLDFYLHINDKAKAEGRAFIPYEDNVPITTPGLFRFVKEIPGQPEYYGIRIL